jgi:hypothetical protein
MTTPLAVVVTAIIIAERGDHGAGFALKIKHKSA